MKLTGPNVTTYNIISNIKLKEFNIYFHYLHHLGDRENYK